MSDLIYTVRARDVVVGMLVRTALDWPERHVLETITRGERLSWRHEFGWISGVRPDADVLVSLPGPSPRDLLCSCNEWQLGQGADNAGLPASVPCGNWSTMVPPVHHADDCPVRRLRLRLWPVGATWEQHGDYGVYVIDGRTIRVQTTADVFALPDDFRASFCDPEVQP